MEILKIEGTVSANSRVPTRELIQSETCCGKLYNASIRNKVYSGCK